MQTIHLFTDSASDLSKEMAAQHDIEVLPIMLNIDGREVPETEMPPQQYWEILRNSAEIPKTSLIAPDDFLAMYERAYAAGAKQLLGIVINSKGSGTYQSACLARTLFYETHEPHRMQIKIYDSQNYSFMYGRIMRELAELRTEGASFDALCLHAEKRLDQTEGYIGIYGLKHAKRSGRITGAAAFIGGALGIKFVGHFCSGTVTVCQKVRGAQALVSKVMQCVQERVSEPAKQVAALIHGDLTREILDEAEGLLKKIGFAGVERILLGPSVLTNSGPDTLLVSFYGRPRGEQHLG